MENGYGTTISAVIGSRQSDRIRYVHNIVLSGSDAMGNHIDEEARTEVITRDGGLLVCSVLLDTGSRLKVSRNGKSTGARIIGQVGIHMEEYRYGFQFTDPLVENFWDVNFPPYRAEDSIGKLVLKCSRCLREEIVYLSEVELMVFETVHVIPHRCEQCNNDTLWEAPKVLGESELVTGNDAYDMMGAVAQARSRTINDRKYARIDMKSTKACLHRAGSPDDIVTVMDVSRGGIRFLSQVNYAVGMKMEVAVPYTPGSANVFTPARIARVQSQPMNGIPGEFGLEYIKN